MKIHIHLEEFAAILIGAGLGSALAAGLMAGLIARVELVLHFAWVTFLAGMIGAFLGYLLAAIVADTPAGSGGVAGLTAFIMSGLTAAPMLLIAFAMFFERWYDITPLVRGSTIFTGFMAAATARLVSKLTSRE